MFSETYFGEIRQYFDNQMNLLDDRIRELRKKESEIPDEDNRLCGFSRMLLEQKREEISGVLRRCTQDEAEALQFLYSAMPLSDILDYPAAVYLAYARHAVFLWKGGPFAGKVPEKLFANYVLHHRVHNEDIADTRSFFYHKLKDRISGRNMYDAAVETNFWCAEKATYQTTFMRTQNPMTMYKTAMGRCGEEAPFASTALRSIGIPAREVAAPWWSHCDDNHAWVEAWCDGRWHFLGGCEPGRCLDKGWFAGPTARAMLIDSRWFGKDTPEEPMLDRPDMSVKVNHLKQYARTIELTVQVTDEEGKPVPDARVDFAVLNYGRFNRVASLFTGREEDGENYGRARIDTGFGDFLVCAGKDDCYGETHVSLAGFGGSGPDHAISGNVSRAEGKVVLRKEMQGLDQWREMDFCAPAEVPSDDRETEEEQQEENSRLSAAADKREKRAAAFYREEDGARVLMRFDGEEREQAEGILRQARGNMGEIVRFLEWDFAGRVCELQREYGPESWKLEALKVLNQNDYWDIRAEVLAECCIYASPYAGTFPREVFFSDLLNPCVMHEFPRACRGVLAGLFSPEQKEQIRKNPGCLPEKLDRFLVSLPEQEYANLVTSPVGCLTGGMGSEISREVLCIHIYRALGIPARIRFVDRSLEYYSEGRFVPVTGKESAGRGTLLLEAREPLKLEDWKHYSLSRFEKGSFMPLFLRPGKKGGDSSGQNHEFELEAGIYRIVTANRLPDGKQLVKVYDFRLQENQTKSITLQMRDISMDSVLQEVQVDDLALQKADGERVMLSSLGAGQRSLVLWLELTKEPTEHILNEMCEKNELFNKLTNPIYFVIQNGADYVRDHTLLKTCGKVSRAELLFHDFGTEYEAISRQTGRSPGKLPLAMIMRGKGCLFADSGYNVGMADTLLRILS